jgi:hypothetical protein
MFHHRSSMFDPRVSAIAGHLRAIEKELGGIGQSAGLRASSGAIADAIGPILNDIVDRFSRGQRVAVDQAASFSDDAINVGARFGNNALMISRCVRFSNRFDLSQRNALRRVSTKRFQITTNQDNARSFGFTILNNRSTRSALTK